jgi:hypothetical protein
VSDGPGTGAVPGLSSYPRYIVDPPTCCPDELHHLARHHTSAFETRAGGIKQVARLEAARIRFHSARSTQSRG